MPKFINSSSSSQPAGKVWRLMAVLPGSSRSLNSILIILVKKKGLKRPKKVTEIRR